MRKIVALLLCAVVVSAGCTVVNTASVPSDRQGGEIFVTAGDIPEAYESLGMIQATASGVLLFGFIDPVGTDIDAGFHELLIPEVEKLGGDGVINVKFHQTQYVPVTQVLFAILFFIPLPSSVTLTGEVVRLQAGAVPVAPAPAPLRR